MLCLNKHHMCTVKSMASYRYACPNVIKSDLVSAADVITPLHSAWCRKFPGLIRLCCPHSVLNSDIFVLRVMRIKNSSHSSTLQCIFNIHRSLVNSSHKGKWNGAMMFFYLCLNKRLSTHSWGWWFETPSHSLWPHYNVRAEWGEMFNYPNHCWQHIAWRHCEITFTSLNWS